MVSLFFKELFAACVENVGLLANARPVVAVLVFALLNPTDVTSIRNALSKHQKTKACNHNKRSGLEGFHFVSVGCGDFIRFLGA